MRMGLMRGLVVGRVRVCGLAEAQRLSARVEAARRESNQAVAEACPDAGRPWQAREERIQAWGRDLQTRPCHQAPAQAWQPVAPVGPGEGVGRRRRTWVTVGGGSPWVTRGE
jgi:hypothetical protein